MTITATTATTARWMDGTVVGVRVTAMVDEKEAVSTARRQHIKSVFHLYEQLLAGHSRSFCSRRVDPGRLNNVWGQNGVHQPKGAQFSVATCAPFRRFGSSGTGEVEEEGMPQLWSDEKREAKSTRRRAVELLPLAYIYSPTARPPCRWTEREPLVFAFPAKLNISAFWFSAPLAEEKKVVP